MRSQLLLFFLILCLTSSVSAQICHYSCKTCTDPYYAHCTTCSDSKVKMTMLVSSSNVIYGICSTPISSGANPIGILIILIAIFSGMFLRSQHIFYFILSLQILGLLSFVQVAFSYPLTLILDSFQYFMVFSQLQYRGKTADGILTARGMNRLDGFIKQVDLKTNIIPIFILALLTAILLGLLLLIRKILAEKCTCISQRNYENILTGLRTFLFLSMQEALLEIYLAIRFADIGTTQMVIIAIYCIILVFLLVDINWHKIPYFRSRKLLNLAIAQRLMLPVLVIIPYQNTYHLVIFLIGFSIVQLLFYIKSEAKTKHYVYSIIHLIVSVLVTIFIGQDLVSNSASVSNIASIFATIGLSVFIGCFLFQIILALKNKFSGSSKVQNKEDWLKREPTNEKIAGLQEQDTLADVIEPNLLDSHKRSIESGEQKKVTNLLLQTKKKQRKFRVHKE